MSSVNTSSNKIRLAPATPNISDIYAVPITTDVHLNFSFTSVDSDVKYNLYRDGVLIEVFSQTNYSSFGSTGFDYLDPGIKGLLNALSFLYYPKILDLRLDVSSSVPRSRWPGLVQITDLKTGRPENFSKIALKRTLKNLPVLDIKNDMLYELSINCFNCNF